MGLGILPRGVVPALAQDKAGFLWLATGGGLVRYDGYRFRAQERDSADPALRNLGWIRALLPGRDGRLWIGTEADGLAVYDPVTEQVTVHPDITAQPGVAKAAPTILALAEDSDGAIWTGSLGGGLARFDPVRRSYTRFRQADTPGSLPDDRVLALRIDRQGTLWVGTWSGLSRRVRGSQHFEPVMLPDGHAHWPGRVQALLETSDGRLWAGSEQGELALIDPASGQTRQLTRAGSAVTCLLEAPLGQVWAGRTQGITLHALADGALLRRLRHDPGRPDGLAANHVTGLLQDRGGWVWVAGLGLGLQRHNPNNHSIWVRAADTRPGSPFEDPDTRSVLALDNGDVWAATHSSGVAVMDASLQVIGQLQVPAPANADRPDDPTPAATAQALVQAGDGTVWLASASALHQYDRQRRLLRSLAHGAGPVRRLLAGLDGTLWVATQDGLYRLVAGEPGLQRLGLSGGLPLVGEVNALAESASGLLWVGSADGLYRLAAGDAALTPVRSPIDAALGNPTVTGLLIDRQQTLWVDTAVAGLHRLLPWDGGLARFERISQRHKSLGRPFGANLMQDARGRIWTHMHVYDPALDRLDELTSADGVGFGTGWFNAYTRTRDGRMLFGGSKGLLVVEPEAFDASVFAPPLVVSELRLNGNRQPAGALQQGLVLGPQVRSFSIEFAALDLSDPGHLRYAYQLLGFDPERIDAGSDVRSASYSNLAPGDYQLRVSATNRSGLWFEDALVVPVRVLPAWWQKGWVGLIGLLLLAGLVLLLVQWRTRQLSRSRQALELKVQERTAKLEALTQALRLESAALQESSLSDPLTGLRNRRFLTQHIDADVAQVVRQHESHFSHGSAPSDDADLVFFLVDIDHFKQLNDSHGHAAGDAVLVQISERLKTVFRDADYLVRWGGEEFLVVARQTARSHAAELAERARKAVADQPFVLADGTLLGKTCSIGFAAFPLDPQRARDHDWSLALSAADSVLYAIKQDGRNGWMGLISARSDSADALRALLRRPVAQWWQTRALVLARSGEASAAAPAEPGSAA